MMRLVNSAFKFKLRNQTNLVEAENEMKKKYTKKGENEPVEK